MKPAEILRELHKFPQKKFGQNFLTDEKVLADILTTADISPDETVVEIGSGLGVLTYELAKRAKHVIAIEADRDLADYLRNKNISNLTVITGDALRIDWAVTLKRSYRVVANIPYSITSPLLRKIFLMEAKPVKVVLLVQKALAERLTAKPGSSERGFLTLLCEAASSVKIVRNVRPGSFHPAPKVDSAIIEIIPTAKNRMSDIFWPAVEAGFRHKRQTLANSLTDIGISKSQSQSILVKMGLDSMIRPQALSYDNWAELSRFLLPPLVAKQH